jgi:cysteine-rich repeat protein
MRSKIQALALAALALAAPALATFHEIKVKEVFPGTVVSPNAQYVVLQAYAAGQTLLGTHKLHVYDAAGAEVAGSPFTFPGPVANGANQMTILIATTEAASLFGVTADLTMTPVLPLTGGKACWEALDCVAWGSYGGSATGVGTPFHSPVGLERGKAMQRRLDVCVLGMPTILEACDDTDDSANDFLFATPAPKNNAGSTGTPPASTCGNNILEGLEGCDDGNAADGDGCSAVCQPEPAAVVAQAFVVDDSASSPPGANGIFEPGETIIAAPAWTNNGTSAVALTGAAASLTGPAGAVYTIADGAADYGSIAPAETASCSTGADCYTLSVSAPATRPAQHWDALFTEVLSNTGFRTRPLHIGGSFPDVPNSQIFYPFIENLFHNGITGGCAGGNYCPASPVTRAQMAVFLLKSKLGSDHVPPACTGAVFTDVPCTGGPFDPWIEELASLGVTGGCGQNMYCPDATVTRQQMAVFLLKAKESSAYIPPNCTGVFADVPCTPGTGFSDWIEELYSRQITGGCSSLPLDYCPTNPNNRGQMAVFLVKTFGLLLYAP